MKLEVINVSKSFKNNVILKDINLTFEKGKIYGLIGRNGSGKSVFLKMLSNLYLPTEGKILYNGEEIDKSKEIFYDMRCLIEQPTFFSHLTGYENLKLLSKIQNRVTDKEILDALKIVNLIDEKDKKYNKYSLGMKQKLGIAQAIMENPKILILDELFNGLDSLTVESVRKYLLKIKKDKIIIITSHIKDDINELADKKYVFENATIKEVENVKKNSKRY